MGTVLLAGGMFGSVIGVQVVKILREAGQFDLFVALSYVTFLGIIGSLMLIESLNALRHANDGSLMSGRKPGQHNGIHGLPLKMRFRRSKLYISALPPLIIGAFRWISRRDHGCRWWFCVGAGDDLFVENADQCGGWDVAVPDRFRDGFYDHLACNAEPDGGFCACVAVDDWVVSLGLSSE